MTTHSRGGAAALTALLLAPLAAAQVEHQPAASRSAMIRRVGYGGLLAVGSGTGTELVVPSTVDTGTAATDVWTVLRRTPATGRYDEVFCAPYQTGLQLGALLLGDVDAAPGPELLAVGNSGQVQVFNLPSRRLLRSLQAPVVGDSYSPLAAALRDLDGDGAAELILASSRDDLKVYDLGGTLRWTLASRPRQLVVGQFDADPALEIACSDGKIVDGGTHALQHDFAAELGALAVADVDQDGREELFASEGGQTRCYDVDTATLAFSIGQGGSYVAVADVTGDGGLDLVLTSQLNNLAVWDLATRTRTWLGNGLGGRLAIADCDGDGQVEIVTTDGRSLFPPNERCYVFDGRTGALEFATPQLLGPFEHLRLCELDGDPVPEVLVRSSDRYAQTLVLSADTLAVEATWSNGLGDCTVVDLDRDGRDEIVSPWPGIGIHRFDANTGSFVQVRSLNQNSDYWYSTRVADLDGDGAPEIVAHSSHQPRCFDLASGQQVGEAAFYLVAPAPLFLADTDGDGAVDVHVLQDGVCWILTGRQLRPTAVLQPPPGRRYTCVGGVELGANTQALLLGDDGGQATVLLPTPARSPLGTLPVTAPLALRDQQLFATPFLWLCGDGQRMVLITDPVGLLLGTPVPAFATDRRGGGMGAQHALWFAGRSLLTTSSAGVFRYEVR